MAAAAAADYASGALALAQRQADRVVSPEARGRALGRARALAGEQPLLFTLLAAQLLAALVPLALFATFVLSASGLAAAAAATFALFWAGAALAVLAPALCLASAAALLAWAWAAAVFLAARWCLRVLAAAAAAAEGPVGPARAPPPPAAVNGAGAGAGAGGYAPLVKKGEKGGEVQAAPPAAE